MIEVLERLVAEGKHRDAVKLAEQILSDGVQTPAQLVAVQSALVVAHFWLKEWEATLAPGEAAMQLAQETGAWDAFGKLAIFVSAAYSRLGRYDAAIARTYDYIAHVGEYAEAADYEAYAWFNLGEYELRLDRPADGQKALTRALAILERRGDHRNAHGARHALIDACLKAGDFRPVPRLLARSGAYLRHHPEGPAVQDSWAYHMRLRAEYALATGRPARAMAVALRGLSRTETTPHHACRFHILLSRIARSCDSAYEAVGHAMAAQRYARQSGRPDVEAEASEVMYQASGTYPDALAHIDRYYLTK